MGSCYVLSVVSQWLCAQQQALVNVVLGLTYAGIEPSEKTAYWLGIALAFPPCDPNRFCLLRARGS
jgi:hypothetical protein